MDADQSRESVVQDTTATPGASGEPVATPAGTSGTVVGVFEDAATAERAVQQLRDSGFAEEQIGYIARHPGGEAGEAQAGEEKDDFRSHLTGEHHGGTREGLVMGGVTGLAFGSIVGAAAALLLPGIGPVIAGGILGAALMGGAAGAVTGGVAGALRHWGFSQEEAEYYHGQFEAGRTLVSVHAGGRQMEAVRILEESGAQRVSTVGGTGVTDTAPGTPSTTPTL